jgi:ribulose-5-phosphate 4-epimerase/fuculose-1-phosphate aldolase
LTEDTNVVESEQKTEEKDDTEESVSDELPNDVKESETAEEIKPDKESIAQADDMVTEDESDEPPVEEPMSIEESSNLDGEEDILLKEAEIARLAAEVERLRSSMVGAAEVIEELENPPMPPIVEEDVVIAAHTVADIARMARQLDRDELVRASMGAIAMLHPESPEVLISTKHSAMLPRMNEKDICAGKLGGKSPRGAPEDWRVLEVLLASASLVTGGPAAVIHAHGPYTTAVSCERDLVLMQPIDEIGKEHIGKIIIVDPDPDNPEEFLRQVAEALQQGGMRCVVVRGKGSYAVGADLDQAWANAAMLEHSMKIVMLARQANLKV